MESQGDTEDLEGQGRAEGSGDRVGGEDLKDRGVAGVTEDEGGVGGKEARGSGWSTTDQGGAGGTREPGGASGMMGHSGDKGARSQRMGFLSRRRNARSMHSKSRFWGRSSRPRECAWIPTRLRLWWIGQPQIPVRPCRGFWGSPISTGILFAISAN